MMVAAYAFELLCLIYAIRRSGFLPFPHGMLIFCVLAQAVVFLVSQNIIAYRFLKVYSSYSFNENYSSTFYLFFCFFVGAALCTPSGKVKVGSVIRSIRMPSGVGPMIILAVYLQMLVDMAALNWDVAWSNSEYLLMAGRNGLSVKNGLTQTIHSMNTLFGLLSTLMLAFFLYSGKKALALAIFPVVAWHFFFQLAGHSRYSAFYLITFAAAGFVLSRRTSLLALLCVVAGLATLVSMLGGRNSEEHGFASVAKYGANISERLEDDPMGSVANIFEGAFVTSEYFARSFQYADKYKNLSLSPLLSAMDGYEAIREQNEERLAAVVPAGAVIEVLSFGAGYAIIFFGVQFLAGFFSARLLAKRPGLLSLSINAMMMLATYLQFTYSTRTVFRLFVVSLVVSLFFLLRRKARVRKRLRVEPALQTSPTS